MSEEDAMTDAPASAPATTDLTNETRPKYKSWRKKYRKMKTRFDDVMKANSNMFKEEQKLESLAKRLQEQNDQLLDILLDLNSSLELPPELRYNVQYRSNQEYEGIRDLDSANRQLYDLHRMELEGRLPHSQVAQIRAAMEEQIASLDCTPLALLEKDIPHTTLDMSDKDTVNEIADPIAYLSPTHEAEYLDRLDVTYGDPLLSLGTSVPREKTPPSFANMTAREIERETELRNPLSVHNWLKKHNINITDAGDDKSDAGTPGAGKKGGGRNLAKKVGDRAVERARERDDGSPMSSAAGRDGDLEEEMEDATPRGRRARDPDESYRPKGGRSGKSKRKREDGESRGASKKPKTSLGGATSDA
ncbi:putative IEC3 subunit of the Ino80 complex [Elsinoe australis]|uniref:Putative IEC3 subunit of the Ino80 complex n=1 Tax=Elsinoe australis TaxID=40998 RepID=A0A4U7B3M0_9PEZI|nr:putative IEC3 subunit of the Ino80 complex [Elsinoe australis]